MKLLTISCESFKSRNEICETTLYRTLNEDLSMKTFVTVFKKNLISNKKLFQMF